MAVENETAEQVVRMILQGSEVVIRLTGEASINVAKMIYSALKGDRTSKGRATLWEFLKSGKEQKMFQIPDEYLKAFTTASKKFGFPFVILKDKNNNNGITDILVYASDAPKVDRVIEKLKLTLNKAEIVKPEVKIEGMDGLKKAFDEPLKVPFELIDNFPEQPADKRLLTEIQKYASKMRISGPQIVEPVDLLCKENGHYEILPGGGSKRLMALRMAGYHEAVADICVPKKSIVEVRSANPDDRPAQERNDSPREGLEPAPVEKATDTPQKEVGQSVNPTMARTTGKETAFGQGFERSSEKTSETGSTDLKRPSVRKELERCKKISESREAAKTAQRAAMALTENKPLTK